MNLAQRMKPPKTLKNSFISPAKGGGLEITLCCESCGKPIKVTNKYGMFCEDLCGLEDAKKAAKEINKLLKSFTLDFPPTF